MMAVAMGTGFVFFRTRFISVTIFVLLKLQCNRRFASTNRRFGYWSP